MDLISPPIGEASNTPNPFRENVRSPGNTFDPSQSTVFRREISMSEAAPQHSSASPSSDGEPRATGIRTPRRIGRTATVGEVPKINDFIHSMPCHWGFWFCFLISKDSFLPRHFRSPPFYHKKGPGLGLRSRGAATASLCPALFSVAAGPARTRRRDSNDRVGRTPVE